MTVAMLPLKGSETCYCFCLAYTCRGWCVIRSNILQVPKQSFCQREKIDGLLIGRLEGQAEKKEASAEICFGKCPVNTVHPPPESVFCHITNSLCCFENLNLYQGARPQFYLCHVFLPQHQKSLPPQLHFPVCKMKISCTFFQFEL